MCAALLARATVTTRAGRRASSCLAQTVPPALRIAHQRCSAENQKSANIPIALLRDAPETLAAAGRMLFWCQPEKGCKVARRLELCRGSHRGGDGRSRNDADPWDRRQPATGFVVPVPGPDRLLDLLDASLQITELVCHRRHRDPGMRRDAAIGLVSDDADQLRHSPDTQR